MSNISAELQWLVVRKSNRYTLRNRTSDRVQFSREVRKKEKKKKIFFFFLIFFFVFLSQSGNASNKNSFSSSGLAGRTVSVEVSKGGAATVVSRAAFPERKVNKNHIPQNNKREKSKLANKNQNQSCDSVSKRSSLNLLSKTNVRILL